MQITIINHSTQEEVTNISADEYLEINLYDIELEDVLNELENSHDDEIIFNHSDGSSFTIIKEIELMDF